MKGDNLWLSHLPVLRQSGSAEQGSCSQDDNSTVLSLSSVNLGAVRRRSRNEKACRGRRCGRLFEKNRTATGRRSAAVPTDVPGRRSGPSETRSSAGGGALLRWVGSYTGRRSFLSFMLHCSYARNTDRKDPPRNEDPTDPQTGSPTQKRPRHQRASSNL
jgi:hypothetical protein